MISASTLASLRATQAAAMPDECEIQRRTFGARVLGGDRSETWATVATVACRMARAPIRGTGQEIVTGFGVLTSTVAYDLTVPHDTDIRGEDRVLYNGHTYEVSGEVEDVTWQTAKRVSLIRLEKA